MTDVVQLITKTCLIINNYVHPLWYEQLPLQKLHIFNTKVKGGKIQFEIYIYLFILICLYSYIYLKMLNFLLI